MVARVCVLLVCLGVAACGAIQRVDTAQLPPGFYGLLIDNDTGAINEASWALGSPDRTRGDPVESLRAAIAVEYLAGELNVAPRWAAMSVITKVQMLQARAEMRRALGIKPDAPAQIVVNAEIAAMVDLERGDGAAAQQVLSSPIFIEPPPQVMQALNNLPTLPAARSATAAAELEQYRRSG
jgi:hypothetical protein